MKQTCKLSNDLLIVELQNNSIGPCIIAVTYAENNECFAFQCKLQYNIINELSSWIMNIQLQFMDSAMEPWSTSVNTMSTHSARPTLHIMPVSDVRLTKKWGRSSQVKPWRSIQNQAIVGKNTIYLAFTNLAFPEIRGFPFLSYLLGWGLVRLHRDGMGNGYFQHNETLNSLNNFGFNSWNLKLSCWGHPIKESIRLVPPIGAMVMLPAKKKLMVGMKTIRI